MNIDLKRKIGETLDCKISGIFTTMKRVRGKYDYENKKKDNCKCPVCGGLGTPWGGLFHCEFEGGLIGSHKSIISTGQCFEVISARDN